MQRKTVDCLKYQVKSRDLTRASTPGGCSKAKQQALEHIPIAYSESSALTYEGLDGMMHKYVNIIHGIISHAQPYKVSIGANLKAKWTSQSGRSQKQLIFSLVADAISSALQ